MLNGPGSSRCCRPRTVAAAGLSEITVRWSKGSSTGSGPALRGVTYPPASGRGRRCGNGIAASARTGPGTGSTPGSWPRPTRLASWSGTSRSTPPSTGRTSTARTWLARSSRQTKKDPRGALTNYTKSGHEPPDHALGRSRGGLSTKIHHLADGKGRPLVMLVGPGQAGDSPMFEHLMSALAVNRIGPGRPRSRPEKVLGDKAILGPSLHDSTIPKSRHLVREARFVQQPPSRRSTSADDRRRGRLLGRTGLRRPEATGQGRVGGAIYSTGVASM